MKFDEAQLEEAMIELLEKEGYSYVHGEKISRASDEVLIIEDLKGYLAARYSDEGITENEIDSIIKDLKGFSASDLYESNKAIMKYVSDGYLLKREDRSQKDLYVQLIDYDESESNIFKVVNQLEIVGNERRIPDLIVYINGLPLVVFEIKSATREEATIHDAFKQITVRYRRDIPELFKYNAISIISDGVNNKVGSFFAKYEFFYAWRKISENDIEESEGINSLMTMIKGLFNKSRLCDVIRNFVYFPDTSRREEKIVCRYPQYYATRKLFHNIKEHRRPEGDGKGGTYFGATGCGKSFTMLFLARLLMKSVEFKSPTIVLITDRTDLDDQLSGQFTNAKNYIGDESVISIENRDHLRELLKGRNSGGVFLTTIHKFTEDTKVLTDRNNVICISDEAHRSQINLEKKVSITEEGVHHSYGFAKYLHDSLPNATYVGFTGTPIDATLEVFGGVVDAYTMTESVHDEITVPIVYEGRAAKVFLDNKKLKEVEDYYSKCEDEGATEHAIEESKKATLNMRTILGDPERIDALANDFVTHYENRIKEGSTVAGKAMFVSSSRPIAYDFYKAVITLRPEWAEVKVCADGEKLSEAEKKEIKPMEKIKMVMTRGKDDDPELYELLGTKDYRKELDRQFKKEKTNFKIAIVVDMWLTGFDVPFLDSIYIDKPVKRHNLIQTISRVNRKFALKEKGLVVDYIGIKKQMNLALAQYSKSETSSIEDIKQSVTVLKDHLELLAAMFLNFDGSLYFNGSPLDKLNCLNLASEFVQITEQNEKRFMDLVKRLKSAYDICTASDEVSDEEREKIYFYLAVRTIIRSLTKGGAPDTAKMNERVREIIAEAIQSDGVEEILKLSGESVSGIDIFEEDYLAKIEKIKLPNTKFKLLQQLLKRAIGDFRKINKVRGVDFAEKFQKLIDKYNEREEGDILKSNVLEDFTDEIIDLFQELKKEKDSFEELGINIEEKAFYDILKQLAIKYDFEYPEEKLIPLSQSVKEVVDDKSKYTDWNKRDDIKAELKAGLIVLLAENGYPPVDRDEVYKEIFEQAENFKKNRAA